jgi:SAM-dependent methyltransferase
MSLIERHAGGLVADIGAGRRPVYFEHVVNFEIVPYDTTDVRGVGECLPFRDNSFDGVISVAVLEHVKNPFLCASEISRILKPGGELFCCVPFLQPLHGYPHHYYNMTHQGLRNLFDDSLLIDEISIYDTLLPISSLTWILRSWAEGLEGEARDEFRNLKVSELLETADTFFHRKFVKELSREKNLELASACVLFAHKAKS